MALDWQRARAEWDDRVRSMGTRAVFNCCHKTPEALDNITTLQRETIFPLLKRQLTGGEKTALDFGCGFGRWTADIADAIDGYCIGTDPTPQLLLAAIDSYTKRALNQPVDFLLYKEGRIPASDGQVDLIWSCMVLSTILDDEMLAHTAREFDRVLAPGGLLFIVDNTAGPPHRPIVRSRWSMSRTVEEYRQAFSAITDLVELGHYVDLGEVNTIMAGRKAKL